ncbi:hypothetical protein MLD38_024970 [Melastoma candidum]|uniref:Uncharacterized protein n=1 Tax=Melastoma candidum TaxID=119954 RepID=A0ACB9NVI6_9MYRT|nr:hypothetical protein MLD38_024970 [Melastoma candidum]
MESDDSCNDIRTASFAVYLKPTDDSFVKRLGDSSRHAVVPREDVHQTFGSMKIANREGEIGVFGAEKYFNGNMEDGPSPRLIDEYTRRNGYKKESRLDTCTSVSKSRSVTASVSSESSWNGHAALLRGFQKNPAPNRQSSFSFNGRGLFRRLGCNKSCSGEKSIHTRKEDDPKCHQQNLALPSSIVQANDGLQSSNFDGASSTGSRREELFAFPVLGSFCHKESEGKRLREGVGEKEGIEAPRDSIEVFGSGHKDKKKVDAVALNLERKLSVLTWDAIPKPHSPKVSPKSSVLNDDLESEASSDLFEIENISGATNIDPLFVPHPPDGFSFYEPSEASIEWSVVTVSAADFSAISEYDEKEVREINSGFTFVPNPRLMMEREGGRNRPASGGGGGGGGLLGCKSHKSVRVAEAIKTIEKPRISPHQRLDSNVVRGGKPPLDAEAK